MLVDVLLILASGISIIAYAAYFLDIQRQKVTPNRWSWLIWSIATAVEALTFNAVSEDLKKSFIFFVSAACCFAVSANIWRLARWEKPHWTEVICLITSIGALLLWWLFQLAVWSHLLAILAVPIAFIPTWKDAYRSPDHEYSRAWGLWTLGDLMTLAVILLRLNDIEELPYIVTELICHAAVWLLVIRGRFLKPAPRGVS